MFYKQIILNRGLPFEVKIPTAKPVNVAGQLKRLEEHIIGPEEFPEKFRPYEKEPWNSRGLRVMPVDNYLVFYIPNKDTGIVTVIRVMYTGRDVDNQLNNYTAM